ncbi:ABC transporter ATP-binding protein [Ructibacterium gallinarum]|uniref:ABC transporter ATP-binding protein n=1 Tax=Ructibacterium gallinarum TaxID=2779355 RepID=A0A9D5M4Z5_9FIRM|nr:ABC transporter ATP-binding protein [Ructibacterium gallinarum]MBE5039634.1 ABC transporter ATP-binding protein [Ructibacterium gallinarum]
MKTFFGIFKMTAKYTWCFVIVGICMLVQIISQVSAPNLIGEFLNLVEDKIPNLIQESLKIGGLLLLVAFLQALTQGLRSYFSHVAAWCSIRDIRIRLFDHIQRLSMGFFQDKQTGQLMSRILSDTNVLELLIAHAGPEVILDILLFTVIMIILFIQNVLLALTAMLVIPMILAATFYFAKRVRPQFKAAHQKTAELMGIIQDDLSGIKEITVFNKQDYEQERVKDVSETFTRLNLSALKKSAIFHPMIGFFNQFGIALVITAGGILAASNGIRSSEIVKFVLYLNMLYTPISAFARISEDLQNALAAGERVLELFDTKSQVQEKENAVDISNVKGEIIFQDVCFAYEKDNTVLKNINLHIAPGEKIALIGATGGGKTTIASLIARFYDPSSGRITLDGHDLKDLTLHSLRENISIVLQDVFLFHGTVAENIAYGVDSPTHEDIVRAAKIANAHHFIIEMPQGYDTIIGERGLKLSGGQKQRLSIARAVLRNKPVLILDEATSAVDNTTEKLIHNAIENVIQNRTTIIIAHRLSTIRNCDKIVVIENGEIAEAGTHEELLSNPNGIYTKLNRA